jgi:exodeoxyribonuclease-3
MSTTIISYNVNGIRAALKKDFLGWLQGSNPDILCLQEIKIQEKDFPFALFEDLGYHCYLYPAQKPGYSGVAILSKQKPLGIHYGCGIEAYDQEGRILRADFEDFAVMSLYLPSGSSSEERQAFKLQFLDDFYVYIQQLKEQAPPLIMGGDYNICHQAIDIHNPKANAQSSGFTPAERQWFGEFLALGFMDTFRHLHPEPHQYSWWSFRARAREKNLGWRIDYQLADTALEPRIKRALLLPEAKHSDHCPVLLQID